MINKLSIAVLIPCYNEEVTIAQVVSEFKHAVPMASIYVYDNASTDKTSEVARQAGAIVRNEPSKGKGNVVRRMFADIDADIYVIVDGDSTYESAKCYEMIEQLIDCNLDMVVGTRKAIKSEESYRRGHVFGNLVLTNFVSFLFGFGFTDMLSGYRVMSRRFVKSFPIISKGFEIETEITVHALQIQAPYKEVETEYYSRPDDSQSKLSTFRDGFHIIKMIILLFKEEKPFQFFGIFFLIFFITSFVLSMPVLSTYMQTGLVPRLPTAILSTGLMILAFFSLVSGVILESISKARLESKKISYLSYNAQK